MSVVVESSVVVSSSPSCDIIDQVRYLRSVWVIIKFSLFDLTMKFLFGYSCDLLSDVIVTGSNSMTFESFKMTSSVPGSHHPGMKSVPHGK